MKTTELGRKGISIESDGTILGTKVFDKDGKLMGGITDIEIPKIEANDKSNVIKVKLTFIGAHIKMKNLDTKKKLNSKKY
jgi:hypothetical protein